MSSTLLKSSNLFSHNREGETLHVLANELVPGDLVKFTTGDRIPADIRLVDTVDLEVDESSLTGETEARKKNTATCEFENGARDGEAVALADRTCIVYMGTLVRNGEFGVEVLLIWTLMFFFFVLVFVRSRIWNCYCYWCRNRIWYYFFDDARCASPFRRFQSTINNHFYA